MAFVRMYPGSDGQAHFEEWDVPFELGSMATAGPFTDEVLNSLGYVIPENVKDVVIGRNLVVKGDWHVTPQRTYTVTLAGAIEIEVGNGEVRRFVPGDVLLNEDLTGGGHRAWVGAEGWTWMGVVPG